MANLSPSVWYTDSAQYANVGAWAALTSYVVGTLIRQATTPTVGQERVFVQTTPTTHVSGATEPSPWTVTRSGATTDATCTWYECTGDPATNGDLTNALTWAQQHASSTAVTAGLIIYDSTSGALQIVTTGGTIGGSVPTFSGTAGTTTADNTATWTSLGAASNFQYWKAPHARLANALAATWGTATSTFYVGDDHAETQSTTISLTSPATGPGFCPVYCVDHTANLPPIASNLKTAATITSTGGNIVITNYFYIYGVTFAVSSSSALNIQLCGINAVNEQTFENCGFTFAGTGAHFLNFGHTATQAYRLNLLAPTISFAAAGQGIQIGTTDLVHWRGGSVIGTAPTTLFLAVLATGIVLIEGADLSNLGSGKTIVAATKGPCPVQLLNCKLGASVTVAASPTGPGASGCDLVISDSGATGYRQERYSYYGTLTTSTSVYNNATDGVQAISWQVITNTNASRYSPFECFQIVVWAAAGTYTATVVQCTSATASLTNADVWVEAEYLGSSSYPISSLATSAPANLLTAGSSLAAGTWATGGAGNNYKLALPSFTTNLAGYVRFTVKVAKASLTVYIDPQITVQ